MATKARHAAVVGGSIAGLCAARALADAFEQVTIVDRDVLPDSITERTGVPQGRHVHALLERGRRELDRLFPGFTDVMRSRGAHEVDFGWDFAALREFGWQPRAHTPYTALFASRSLLESTVRELLRRHPNVAFQERTTVIGFLLEGDGHPRVRGVQIEGRGGGPVSGLNADLVVDAGGRGSRTPDWLRALGVTPPEETVVDALAGYSTRWYRAPDPSRWPREWWWKGIWVDPLIPTHMTAGVLFPVEGGRWIVTVAALGAQPLPADEAAFDAAIKALRSPLVAEAVALAEPLSPVYHNRAMENRFRHYEGWREPVAGLVVLGDAACHFNPVYGQGMSVAAACAVILGESLKATDATTSELPRHFFRRQAEFLHQVWGLAVGADFRFPGTKGKRPPAMWLVNTYMDELFGASFKDTELRDTIIDVMHLIRPASALFSPPVMARVAVAAVRRHLSGGAEEASSRPPGLSDAGAVDRALPLP